MKRYMTITTWVFGKEYLMIYNPITQTWSYMEIYNQGLTKPVKNRIVLRELQQKTPKLPGPKNIDVSTL